MDIGRYILFELWAYLILLTFTLLPFVDITFFTNWRFMETLHWENLLTTFFFFIVAPTTYGGSQARGLIRPTVARLCHSLSNTRPEPCLQPTPQLMAMLDPNITFKCIGTQKILWLALLQYLVYYGGLEWNPQYLWGMLVVFLFSSDKYPEVVLLDYIIVLLLIFSILFTIVAAPIYILTNS